MHKRLELYVNHDGAVLIEVDGIRRVERGRDMPLTLQTRAADILRAAGVPLIVLDCMGHADDAARRLEARSGARVLLAQSLAARVAGELVRSPAPGAIFPPHDS